MSMPEVQECEALCQYLCTPQGNQVITYFLPSTWVAGVEVVMWPDKIYGWIGESGEMVYGLIPPDGTACVEYIQNNQGISRITVQLEE